ncbi:type 1 periplasmic binding fold superfamily protein [Mariniflexile gromovii]|uniref:Type 1 periplasmic binding fold superfamily protein n=1 Tax=Mariniflexile gromovii TaxID=362523 RepID=A0ABS4BW63_9FLAO|nr:type 1 periplasmic binding fold superfamily protein [Mariniflexile gromovii]MBP0904603.1 type 1 periplasmic binding fold superfamily protein [Mariniflexile gromovii]
MKTLKYLSLLFITSLSLTACSSDNDPEPVNEEELITTVTATFVPQGGGTTITLKSQDLDGDGGNAPVITVSGKFEQNKTYNGTVTFLNESVNPAEDITEEIEEEGDEHQIFYIKTGSLNGFTYSTDANNLDSNGLPIGLQTVFNTTNAASGNLTIILRHEPNKSASGVSNGDITNAGGSTDASVTFSIEVE